MKVFGNIYILSTTPYLYILLKYLFDVIFGF
ncbi:hypothetical protein SAMN05216463_1171 [Xylanibacter ruminicola]|uniref:Uncharacterized protein n=1 Tax=Xylanibacter ruminicola TaxID=839 RepID=A0A1M6WJU8_XYLRU|nr:hypothetical protein SAMN05216463_1171 [Xylanibacter ruminicola]